MKRDNEPKVWVIVLKLIIGALVLIGLVGGALMLAGRSETAKPVPSSGTSWGVSGDSPVHMKR